MDRIGADGSGGSDDGIDLQVTLGCGTSTQADRLADLPDMQGVAVGIGMDPDGCDAAGPRGARNPAGDFAAIGDEKCFYFHGWPLTS